MKKIALILPVILLSSCGTPRVTTHTETQVVIKDSIAWHDSTIVSYITKERYKDVVVLTDTLLLETEYAKAKAYVDTTTSSLKGNIENKDTTPIITQIKWKEKISYRDSIVYKEVPVDVEVIKYRYPTSYWIFLGITVILLIYIGIKLYLKLKI